MASLQQRKSGTGGYPASTTVTFDSSVTAGNTIMVFVCNSSGDANGVSSVTDNQSNTYTLVGEDANNMRATIYYAKNVTGGTVTVTVNFDTNVAFMVEIREYDLPTDTAVDVVVDENTAYVNSHSVATGTPTNSGGFGVAFFAKTSAADTTTFTNTAGFSGNAQTTDTTDTYFYATYISDGQVSGTTDTTTTVTSGSAFRAGGEVTAVFNDSAGGTPAEPKIKLAGTFGAKPLKHKASGTFTTKTLKVKVSGTFQDVA